MSFTDPDFTEDLNRVPRPEPKQVIPTEAKKVFSGKIFSVYQWPQRMYNGKTATFEALERRDTCGILAVTEDRKIVCTKQEQPSVRPFSGLLGGVIDPGEKPFETAQRELREEAGMEAAGWQFWFSTQPLTKMNWSMFMYIAKGCRVVGEQQLDGGEKIKLELLDFPEFLDLVFSEDFREFEIALRIAREVHHDRGERLKQLLFD